jgi:hypothetical protein
MTIYTPLLESRPHRSAQNLFPPQDQTNAGARTWSAKVEQGDTVLEQDVGRGY